MANSLPHVGNRAKQARFRVALVMAVFACLFSTIGIRLVWLGNQSGPERTYPVVPPPVARPDIVDRQGATLAMDIPSLSVYAEPRRILDLDEAVEGLMAVFPDLDMLDLRKRLEGNAAFTWIKRVATPAQKDRLWTLGIPGVGFRDETKRLYTNGTTGAHVLGSVNVDNVGVAGIERWIDEQGLKDLRETGLNLDRSDLAPVILSVDLRVQHALTDELTKAIKRFDALAGAGLILDVRNGEVIALASLPDFDPNSPADALNPDRINRINVGTYEMGSTFKAMTTAMALESGAFNIHSMLDAREPLRFGRMAIRDYRGQNRPLNVPEAFIHSSNIAMARMALGVGIDKHQAFLGSLGQFDRLVTELPENAQPILPAKWGELTTATAAFGHGIAVAPLQAAMAITALVNGGDLIRPTFIKGTSIEGRIIRRNVITRQTGEAMRFLMRLNAEIGSAKKADVPGYFIGGKTGTSEKVVNGRYSSDRVLTSFMGVAPADKPRYLFLTILDEPKPLPETFGFRTSGWNAVPVTGEIMKRALPLLSVVPYREPPVNPFPEMVMLGAWGIERFLPKDPFFDLVAAERSTAPIGCKSSQTQANAVSTPTGGQFECN
ncbi:penicillin-binding protein 2 [Mesorhizobium sp. M0047]|uniref:peptidoglycan D,D-transpeptidase FtsI family protein n=1 Tax=Mesorhizobium sp. M0047 TaxID=2956859 RepID=UPI003335EC46